MPEGEVELVKLVVTVCFDDGHKVAFDLVGSELQYIGPDIAVALVERGIERWSAIDIQVLPT